VAASGLDLPLLIGQLALVLGLSRAAGALGRRLGQPMVIAEIAVGIGLGPTVLGRVSPELMEAIFPARSLGALDVLAQVGLLLFMFVVGLEFDAGLLRGRGKVAVQAAVGGVLLPLLLGGLLGALGHAALAPPGVPVLPFALFIGASMSATAFPVLARIVGERGLLRTPLGGVTMAIAAVADVVAWMLVAVAIAAAGPGGTAGALRSVGLTGAGLAFVLLGVRPFLKRLARRHLRGEKLTPAGFALALLLLLVVALGAEATGVHAMLGAFLFGAIVPREAGLPEAIAHRVEDTVVTLFLPVFFAVTGLRTDLGVGLSGEMLGVTALVIAIATVGKVVGTTLPAWRGGLEGRDALTLGVLMNTRGLMELVILGIGREIGVLTDALYASMVVMALVTTAATSPLLQWLQPAARVVARQAGAGPAAGGRRVLVSAARAESVPALAGLGASLAAGGDAVAASLCPVSEDGALVPQEAADTAARALAGALAGALGAALGRPVSAMSFPSAAPGRDLALLAELQGADLVLVGTHTPLIGTAVLGGPLLELAAGLRRADLAMLVDRGGAGEGPVLLLRGGAHDAAVGRLGERLRAAGREVRELQAVQLHGLPAAAAGAALVVLGVGPPWGPAMAAFDLRGAGVLDALQGSICVVHAPGVG